MLWIIYIAIVVLIIAAWWQIFTKAGEEGWKAIIPIYNIIVLLKIVGREWWWVLLMLIPFVGLIVWIIVSLDLAKSFGRGVGFAIGLILLAPIFGLILGFGSDTYRGPAAKAVHRVGDDCATGDCHRAAVTVTCAARCRRAGRSTAAGRHAGPIRRAGAESRTRCARGPSGSRRSCAR